MKVILNEGVIKVPEKTQTQAYYIAKLSTYQTAFEVFESTPIFLEFLQQNLTKQIKNHGREYSINDLEGSQALIHAIMIEHESVPYSDQDEGAEEVSLGLVNFQNRNVTGAYDSNNDIVVLNFAPLIESLSSVRDIHKEMYTNSDNTKEEIFEELELFDFHKTVQHHIKQFLADIKSTIEHELAHYIQYHFLQQKSEKQVQGPDYKNEHGSKENYDEYFGSEVEYSPQIISSVRDFENFFDNLTDQAWDYIDQGYKKQIIEFMVGQRDLFPTISDYNDGMKLRGIDNSINSRQFIKLSRNFFSSLKETNKEKWKKAVKYLWNELNNRNLI